MYRRVLYVDKWEVLSVHILQQEVPYGVGDDRVHTDGPCISYKVEVPSISDYSETYQDISGLHCDEHSVWGLGSADEPFLEVDPPFPWGYTYSYRVETYERPCFLEYTCSYQDNQGMYIGHTHPV